MDRLQCVEGQMQGEFALPGIDFNSLITFQTSLSDGINKLPPPRLYTRHCQQEIASARFATQYTMNSGYPALNEAIKYYEKLLGVTGFALPEKLADHVCITAGASPAIVFFFEYYSYKYPNAKVLFLGLNYFLFYECMRCYQLQGVTLMSKEANRIAPTMDEVIAGIERDNPGLVSLTMPLNPSGEMYTESELRRLVRFLKERDCLLLYDKCQLEELTSVFPYVNLNKIVLEEDFVDNLIVIHSISKTRSLPGARLGYIYANQDIMQYVLYLNKLYYWNAPLIYITPFIMDLLYRIVFIKRQEDPEMDSQRMTRAFRNFILMTAGADVYLEFFKALLTSSDLHEQIQQFHDEIQGNYQTIYDNYHYTQAVLKDHLAEITELQGGYNFCIKLRHTSTRKQLQFCSEVTQGIRVSILPEYCYNDHIIHETDDPFWIRITAAFPQEVFREFLGRLARYMDTHFKH